MCLTVCPSYKTSFTDPGFNRTRENWPAPRRGRLTARSANPEPPSRSQIYLQPAPHSGSPPLQTSFVATHSAQLENVSLESPGLLPPDRSDHFVRTNLSCFFGDGDSTDWWRVYQVPDEFRVAYIGTAASNLAHLVKLRRAHGSKRITTLDPEPRIFSSEVLQHEEVESTLSGQAPSSLGRQNPNKDHPSKTSIEQPSQQLLHYPYPRIRPHQAWRPQSELCLQMPQDLATELTSFPAQEVREALVTAYFDNIHPSFPVVTEPWILEPNRKPRRLAPLLLYQAVLLAGAHVSSHPLVTKDRQMVKSVLYRRASMLYHLRHETDRLLLMQAALLFTWHLNDGDTVAGGPWYWAGEAVRIGCGLGMHRHNDHLPIHDRIFYKRTWWCAFVAEVFASLEMGRPCAVRREDIDQSRLSAAELNEIERELVSSDPDWRNVFEKISLEYHLHMVELAFIALDVLSLNSPSTLRPLDTTTIDVQLASWAIKSRISHHDLKKEDFFTKQLRIHYHLVVLHLHRNFSAHSSVSRQNCSTAANSIISSLEEIAASGWLSRCQFTVVGAATAAGIEVVGEIRSSIKEKAALVALNHTERLDRLLRSTKLLAQTTPSAEAVYTVFESLQQEYHQFIAQGFEEEETTILEHQLDWDSLFASMQATQFDDISSEQEWLSFANWSHPE